MSRLLAVAARELRERWLLFPAAWWSASSRSSSPPSA